MDYGKAKHISDNWFKSLELVEKEHKNNPNSSTVLRSIRKAFSQTMTLQCFIEYSKLIKSGGILQKLNNGF